jgi:hypothetical protein
MRGMRSFSVAALVQFVMVGVAFADKGGIPHHAAPGPVLGAGLPVLAAGYGAYWLMKRYRRTSN